jgi:hypothetical protein
MMCCKLAPVSALDKPMGKWCTHAVSGRGCAIHDTRPGECRSFHCEWLLNPTLGPEWKPEKAKFVVVGQVNGNVSVLADSGAPRAWRDERFYPLLKLTAARLFDEGRMLSVHHGKRITIILPEQDLDIGEVPENHNVQLRQTVQNGQVRFEAMFEPF